MTDSRVFVLGAGFSRAISTSMNLSDEDQMPLTADFASLFEAESGFDESEVEFLRRLFEQLGCDFERLASALADPGPWVPATRRHRFRALLDQLLEMIAVEIDDRQQSTSLGACPSWLDRLVRHWHENQSIVVSFNYDLLVELAAKTSGLIDVGQNVYEIPIAPVLNRVTGMVFGPAEIETFRLLKLHGSLNWYREDLREDAGGSFYCDEQLLGFTGGIEPQKHGQINLKAGLRRVLIPPVSAKTGYYGHPLIRAQWESAARALSAAGEIILIGYSLPPTDLTVRDMVATSFKGSTCRVVNRNAVAHQNVEELFATGDGLGDVEVVQSHSGDDAIADYTASLG